MIRLTYEHICDGCKALLDTQTFDCSNIPGLEFPKPHRNFSFDWLGLNAQLCNECAQPMYLAQEETMKKIRDKRNAT
jgi:hypothetical protein